MPLDLFTAGLLLGFAIGLVGEAVVAVLVWIPLTVRMLRVRLPGILEDLLTDPSMGEVWAMIRKHIINGIMGGTGGRPPSLGALARSMAPAVMQNLMGKFNFKLPLGQGGQVGVG